ncbi:helix-turn-helix domain-containing protein [Streptomyces sp. 135]|uniref:helix-turn-helix domain-containing protein n=1 Tax=Streptomyces sp. 135 TaxID=2838850 RepID=UPI001CBD5B21|nr:helix-turn-helix domain-containing protein [Streptomyces sp. 135]
MGDVTVLPHSRIGGEMRSAMAADFKDAYLAGDSVRAIAAGSGRSYGFVHTLLSEAGVDFRARGGSR